MRVGSVTFGDVEFIGNFDEAAKLYVKHLMMLKIKEDG